MSYNEAEILLKLKFMDQDEKKNVLNFIRELKGKNNSKRKYRRQAMKQIREALSAQL